MGNKLGKYVTASLAVGQDGHQVWRLSTNSSPPVWGWREPNNFSLKEINMTKTVSQSLLHVDCQVNGNETLGCIKFGEYEETRKY
jgi:hypothetical protein